MLKNKIHILTTSILVAFSATNIAYAQENNIMPTAEEMEQEIRNVMPVQTEEREVEVTAGTEAQEVEVLPTKPPQNVVESVSPTRPMAQPQEPTTAEPTQPIPSTVVPAVPANVLTTNVPRPIKDSAVPKKTVRAKASDNAVNNYSSVAEGNTLFVEFGINQIVPIAVGHLNRFVTPFSEPVVTTSSDAVYEVKDNVIYVGTDKQKPVTMFVTENGSENQAISLTLVPQQIPPREVNVRFPAGGGGYANQTVAYGSKKAEAWETSQPYVETIKNLFRSLALNELPQGYQIVDTPRNLKTPTCAMPGLRFDFKNGQYLAGRNLSVFVGVAVNVSGNAIEFKENVCGDWDIAAVAAWPRNVLNSGEKTEVYVAIKQNVRTAPKAKRPSLID